MKSRKPRLLVALWLIALAAVIVTPLSATAQPIDCNNPPSGVVCKNDEDGANDIPGQKDLTLQFLQQTGSGTLTLGWNWDDTGWTGKNTGDACALFDSDGDGNANYALCVSVHNTPAVKTTDTPILYSCADSSPVRCFGSASVSPFLSTCSVQITADQPFPSGDNTPNDTKATCDVQLSDVGGANTKFINSCSYPSAQPNSSYNDCIVIPRDAFVTIVKQATPNDGTPFPFTLKVGSNPPEALTTINGSGSAGPFPVPSTANFTIAEVVPSEWVLNSIRCLRNGSEIGTVSNPGVTLDLNSNDQVTCTFVDTRNNPSLAISKVADASSVSAGTAIGYTITATNNGAGTATGVVISDTLPTNSGLSWSIDAANTTAANCSISLGVLTCNQGTLAPGASVKAHVTSPTTSATCGTVSNTASVASGNDGNPSSGPISITVRCPDLSISKVADASSVSAGTAIGYTITATNNGAGTATGVVISDTLPTNSGLSWSIDAANTTAANCSISLGVLTCNQGTLAPGASVKVHVTSPTTSATCGTVSNTASVASSNDGNPSVGPVSITVNCPELSIAKTADAATVSAGAPIGYKVIVTNNGDGTATGVVISDTLPTNSGLVWSIAADTTATGCGIASGVLTCNQGSLASGASVFVHVTSPTTSATCGTVSNTASVASSNDGNPSSGPIAITVNCPNVSVVKRADAASVSAGSPIGYTITVSNAGPGAATGVVITDTLPSNDGLSWTIDAANTSAANCSITSGVLTCNQGTLAPSTSVFVHVTSPTTSATCGSVSNRASVTVGNGTGGTSELVSITVDCPNVSITKTADAASVSSGSAIGYTITVSNAGPGTATGVVITDTLPTNDGLSWTIDAANTTAANCSIAAGTLTCNQGSLLSGESVSVHITSPTTSATCGTVSNGASATVGNGSDPSTNLVSITVDCPNVSILKTSDAASVSAGSTIGYKITVTNSGPGTATGVVISDTLPTNPGLSWSIAPDTTAANCSITAGTLTCNQGDLAPSTSVFVHVTSPTTSATCGSVGNSASVAVGNGTGGTSELVPITVDCPNISIVKEADATSVSSGSAIGYAITVSNSGPGTATGVVISDTLPTNPGLSWTIDAANTTAANCSIAAGTLTCNQGDLASGASVSVHITSPTTAATCGTVSNSASVTVGNGTGGSSDLVSITVDCPNVSIVKTADGASVSSGSAIGYTITVSNAGPGTATGVVISDTLPTNPGLSWTIDAANTSAANCTISAGVLTCNQGDLASGASVSVHVTSPTTSASCGTVSNGASATVGNGSDPSTDLVSITVDCPNVSILKTSDAASVSAGSTIGYKITVTNSGPGTATGVVISDTLPTNPGLSWSIAPDTTAVNCSITAGTLTCNQGDLLSGATVFVHVTSPTTSATCGSVSNSASVAVGNGSGASSGAVSITVLCPNIAIVKTADAASVSAGTSIGYTVTVTNNGPGTAAAVTMTDTLPSGFSWTAGAVSAGWTCSIASNVLTCGGTGTSLASGESLSVHLTAPTTESNCGIVTNAASATTSNDGNPSSGPVSITVNCPNVSVSKTADASSVSAGSAIGYTITVTNNGAGTATDVTLTDTLPAGLTWTTDTVSAGWTCTIATGVLTCGGVGTSLAPGGTLSVHISATTAPANCGTVINTASVSVGNGSDPSSEVESITVNCPNVSVSKTADASSVSAGSAIGYTITVSNTGAGTATNVTLTDTLPAGFSWSFDAVSQGWTCSITSNVLTCGGEGTSLAPNGSLSVHISASTSADNCGSVRNTALVSLGNGLGVSSGVVTISVNCPNVAITKTADAATVDTGSPIGYTITATNAGSGTATGVVITDTLPTNPGLNWTIDAANTTAANCSISAGVLTCTQGDLAPNSSVSVHITSTTTRAVTCGTVSNRASVVVGNDHSQDDTTDPVTITVDCHPVLAVSKSACPGTVVPGGSVTYTISYGNTGTAAANDVMLVDTIPANTEVTNPGGGTVSGNTITWNIGTLAVGESGTKTIILLVHVASGTPLHNAVALSASNATTATGSADTPVSNAGAITHGSSYGADVKLLGLHLINELGKVSTVAPGSPQVAEDQLAVVPIPGVVTISLVRQTSNSSITEETLSTATSTVAGVNLLSGAITADVVKGVSQSLATPTFASSNSAGSTFANLKINGNSIVNVAPNTTINVKNPLLGSQIIARAVLMEEAKSATFANGKFSATHSINMIHVTLLKPFLTLPAGAEIIVAHAQSDATYPNGLPCGTTPGTVSGEAFTAFAEGTLNGVPIATVKAGDAVITPLGGSDADNAAAVTIPGVLFATAADNTTSGAISPNPNATARSIVTGLNLLNGAITANLLDVQATSTTTATTASTSFTTRFLNLVVGGTPIANNPAPNTTIAIPQPDGSLLLVIINERIVGGNGTKDTEGTVNALHVWVLKNQAVQLEVIVSSAHSDAHHS